MLEFHFERQENRESPTRPRYWRNVGIEDSLGGEDEDVNPLNQKQRVVWIERRVAEQTVESDTQAIDDSVTDSDDGERNYEWLVQTAELTPAGRPTDDSVAVTEIGVEPTVEAANDLAMQFFADYATGGALAEPVSPERSTA